MFGYRGLSGAGGPPHVLEFPASRSRLAVPPDAARASAISRPLRGRLYARAERRTASSIRFRRGESPAAACCASPFRPGSNSRCRSSAPVRAIARLRPALRRRLLRLTECLWLHCVLERLQLSRGRICREMARVRANRFLSGPSGYRARHNRARGGSPDQ